MLIKRCILVFILFQLTLSWILIFNSCAYSQSSQLTLQTGHSDDINTIAFSSDGKYLASAGKDNVIIIWDFILGKEIRRLKGHTNQINDIKFLTTNNLISAGEDGKIIFWDLTEGKSIRIINNKNRINFIEISPDHALLSASGINYPLRILNLSDTNKLPIIIDKRICSSISFNKNGKEIIYSISNKKEKGTYIYNLLTNEARKVNKVTASNCIFDKSGNFYISSYLHSSKIRMNNFSDNKSEYIRPGDYAKYKFINIVISSNDSIFAAGNYDNSIYIFEKKTGKRKLIIREFKLPPRAVQFHPINSELIVFSAGRAIIVWNIKDNKLIRKIESSVFPVSAANVNYNGKLIALAGIDNSIKVYDLNNNIKINYFKGHQANVTSLSFVSLFDTIATVGLDNNLHYWQINDTIQKKAIKVIKNPMVLLDKTISATIPLSIGGNMLTMFLLGKSFFLKNYEVLNTLSISKDKKYLATGGGGWRGISSIAFPRSFPIYIYNNITQKREFKLYGHYYRLKSLSFNRTGEFLASCARNDKYLKIWNLKTKKLKDIYFNPRLIINSVEFNPVNDTLCYTDGGNVYLFDMNNDTAIILSYGRAPLKFNNDGKSVFFQDYNYNIVQYNLENKKIVNTFVGHNDIISSISIVDDCSRMVSSSWDGTVKLWDVVNGKEIVTFIALNNTDYILKTPDNYYLATKKAKKEIGFSSGLKFYPFEQYDLQYNRPDIILARLGIATDELIKAYYQAYNKRLKKMGFSEDMFANDFHLPEVSIIDADKLPINTIEPKISFTINAIDSKYNLNRVSVWVNNVPLFGVNGINLRQLQTNVTNKVISIDLSQGKNIIQVSCLNEKGVESLKESFEITYQPNKIIKPDLYIVAIGASEYQDKQWNLTYAAKDANDFSELFNKQKSNYENIYTTKILNQEATVENIRKIKQKLQLSHVDDVVMIFYAGHGLLDDSLDYYLATYNINFNKPSDNGLKYEDLDVLLDSIPARNKILFIDACHSGEVDKESSQELVTENVVEKDIVFRGVKPRGYNSKSNISYNNSFELMKEMFSDLRKGTGAVVVSSAGGGEFAFEGANWKNGVFTYSMLNGLNTFLADKNKDNKITISELQDYIMKQVQNLTNGMQKPTMRQENIENDFVIWSK